MLLSGWFQDLPGQKECIPCPAGFHCQPLNPGPTRGTSLGVSSPLPCPAGHICPRDSLDNQPVPCPKGTYSSSQGLISTGGNRIFLYYVFINYIQQITVSTPQNIFNSMSALYADELHEADSLFRCLAADVTAAGLFVCRSVLNVSGRPFLWIRRFGGALRIVCGRFSVSDGCKGAKSKGQHDRISLSAGDILPTRAESR